MARNVRGMYAALREQGFTDEQAIELTAHVLRSVIGELTDD